MREAELHGPAQRALTRLLERSILSNSPNVNDSSTSSLLHFVCDSTRAFMLELRSLLSHNMRHVPPVHLKMLVEVLCDEFEGSILDRFGEEEVPYETHVSVPGKNYFSTIGNDTITKCLRFLPVQEVAIVSTVSSNWQKLAKVLVFQNLDVVAGVGNQPRVFLQSNLLESRNANVPLTCYRYAKRLQFHQNVPNTGLFVSQVRRMFQAVSIHEISCSLEMWLLLSGFDFCGNVTRYIS
jgi:hypothetical protein